MFFVLTKFTEKSVLGGDDDECVSYEVHAGPFEHYVDARDRAREVAGNRSNMFMVAKVQCGFQRPKVPEVMETDFS